MEEPLAKSIKDELNTLSAKHRVLDMHIDELWKSYVSDSMLKKLKYKKAKLKRSYWDWQEMISANNQGVFPYTPATNLLYGLSESIKMIQEEGLGKVMEFLMMVKEN